MAQITDPKKSFQFNVLAAGLNPYAVQRCNLPDLELEVIEHGDIVSDVKTAGKVKIGIITMEKLMPLNGNVNWIWNWIQGIQNQLLSTGQISGIYKRNLNVVQYAPDMVTITDDWQCQGVWPSKINGLDLTRAGTAENVLEVIEFQVDKIIKRK